MRFSREYAAIEDIPEEETPLPLGFRSQVQAAISQIFQDTDWSDPAWGMYYSPLGSVEFNLGESEMTDGFMLHVRATERVVALIVDLCQANHWQALDCGSGDFLESSSDPAAWLKAWTAFRTRVIDDSCPFGNENSA
jgi:hypothetical protein